MNFLERILETSMDGIVVNEASGKIVFVNSAVEKMSGYRRSEILGQHVSMLASEDEEVRKSGLERMKQLYEKGNLSFETAWCRKNGIPLAVEQNCSIIKDEGGNVIVGVSVVRDISERKKAESARNHKHSGMISLIFSESSEGV